MTMPKFDPVAHVDEDDDNKWATLVDGLDIKLNAPLYTADQLTEAYEAGKQDQTAEQAKNVGLRELVKHFALIDLGRSLLPDDFGLWVLRARKAIATPSDISALEAIVERAGEVMRLEAKEMILRELFHSTLRINLIDKVCALPTVTLEDLK